MSVAPIVRKGGMLYDSHTQERFLIKGIDYAPNPVICCGDSSAWSADCAFDPNSDGCTNCQAEYKSTVDLFTDDNIDIWSRDLDVLADLNVNAVRLYEVDPSASHELFMAALAERGIYAVVSLTRKQGGYLDASLRSPDCYASDGEGTALLYSAKLIVNAFSKFDNTLMFTVGNEVCNSVNLGDGAGTCEKPDKSGTTTSCNGFQAIPCVKALARDIHAWQRNCSCSMRNIPLVYAAQDIPGEDLVAAYLTCDLSSVQSSGGADLPLAAVDVYGVNAYTWCSDLDPSTPFENTWYHKYFSLYETYDRPVAFTEYGCNQQDYLNNCPYDSTGRDWQQVPTLFGEDMSSVFSGGFVFEYSMESNDFGIVVLPGHNIPEKDEGADIYKLETYDALSAAYGAVVGSGDYDGDWDDDDRCEWTPPLSGKSQPACPSSATVQSDIFDSKGFSLPENWIAVDLPSTPTGTEEIACPQWSVQEDSTVAKENACLAGTCVCYEIEESADCPSPLDADSDPDAVANLFTQQCGLFALPGVPSAFAGTCDKIAAGGVYEHCTNELKAAFVLGQWADGVKQGTECCSNMTVLGANCTSSGGSDSGDSGGASSTAGVIIGVAFGAAFTMGLAAAGYHQYETRKHMRQAAATAASLDRPLMMGHVVN